jgi:hypothetical protein
VEQSSVRVCVCTWIHPTIGYLAGYANKPGVEYDGVNIAAALLSDTLSPRTTFCYLPDCLGVVEMIYNTLLAEDGGTFVANAVNKSCLVGAAEHDESTNGSAEGLLPPGVPFAELATRLQGLGYSFHVFEEREDKVLLLLRKHAHSPRQMQLGHVLEYIEDAPAGASQDADARPVFRLK